MIKKLVGGVISKDLKSSHQTGQTFHKSYNKGIYAVSFVFFTYVLALAKQRQPFFSLKPLEDVINCDVIA